MGSSISCLQKNTYKHMKTEIPYHIHVRMLSSLSYQYYYYYSPTILFFNSTSTCCFLLLVIILFVSFLHYFLHGFFTNAFPFLTDFDMIYLSQGLSKTTSLPSECKGKAVYTLTFPDSTYGITLSIFLL